MLISHFAIFLSNNDCVLQCIFDCSASAARIYFYIGKVPTRGVGLGANKSLVQMRVSVGHEWLKKRDVSPWCQISRRSIGSYRSAWNTGFKFKSL